MEAGFAFDINGESITEMIHTMICERKSLRHIFALLKQSLDGASDKVVWDLILGSAVLKGRSSDDTLSVSYSNEVSNDLVEQYDSLLSDYDNLVGILNAIASYDTELAVKRLSELRDTRLVIVFMSILDRLGMSKRETVMRQTFIGKEEKIDESGREGWLRPDGKFIPVRFGFHVTWAFQEIDRIGAQDDFEKWKDKTQSNVADDFLIQQKGYVLLHDPSISGRVGVYSRTRLGRQVYTAEQREFIEKFKLDYNIYEG